MANIKSQIKRNRQNEKARLRNRQVRAELHTRTKAVLAHAEAGEDTAESLQAAIKRIDSAVTKGILHKNTGARKKSRLIKQVRALEGAGELIRSGVLRTPHEQHSTPPVAGSSRVRAHFI